MVYLRTMRAMISALAFVVTTLATARVTRIITTDYLTAEPRRWLITRLGVDSKISYLITCQWCTSVWVGAALAPLPYWAWSHWWVQVPLMALAASQITGVMSRGEED